MTTLYKKVGRAATSRSPSMSTRGRTEPIKQRHGRYIHPLKEFSK